MLIWADRKWKLGHGKVFALYVALYTAGRFWIEALRIDSVNEIGGFRLNNYTSLIVFVVALVWLIWLVRNRPGRESVVEGPDPSEPKAVDDQTSGTDAGTDEGQPAREDAGSGSGSGSRVDEVPTTPKDG